jgi:HAD superfamily phosphatase (TIGR01668 family)
VADGWFKKFLEMFQPDIRTRSATDLDPRSLRDEFKTTHVIFDLENTLVPYKSPSLTEDARRIIDRIRQAGLEVSIVSNSPRSWVAGVLEGEGIRYVGMAAKPRKSGFVEVLRACGSDPSNTLHVGDQLITDVYGAHRMGMKAALVDPLTERGPLTTHIQRRILVPVLRLVSKAARLPDPLEMPKADPGVG